MLRGEHEQTFFHIGHGQSPLQTGPRQLRQHTCSGSGLIWVVARTRGEAVIEVDGAADPWPLRRTSFCKLARLQSRSFVSCSFFRLRFCSCCFSSIPSEASPVLIEGA